MCVCVQTCVCVCRHDPTDIRYLADIILHVCRRLKETVSYEEEDTCILYVED